MRPEVTESITASALAHGYPVLTSNVDDFKMKAVAMESHFEAVA